MAPDINPLPRFSIGGKITGPGGLYQNIPAMASYPFPHSPKPESCTSTCFTPLSDETRSQKRVKHAESVDEFVEINSPSYNNSTLCSGTNCSNSMSKLHFHDHVWAYSQGYLAVEAMEGATVALVNADLGNEVREEENGDEMRLVQLLLACAEGVACRDKFRASALLFELRAKALVFGSSFQRVASCFIQGLSDRLEMLHLQHGAAGAVTPALKAITSEKEEALSLVYEICPQIQFGHFVANASILEALEEENSVHVVHLGMTLGLRHGHQWRYLMHSLANRAGRPPCHLRITGVGNSGHRLGDIGHELERYALGLGLKFEFLTVEESLENLQVKDINVHDGEALVINSILQLHCTVKESRRALNSILQTLLQLCPKVLILVEQDSSHNGPFFLGRFMEALHYYSAIFDSLDAMLPRYDARRAKMEQFYFAEEIKNIVSCEGEARVERHERVDQWRRRMSRAGFRPSPIKLLTEAKQWLSKVKLCEGYTIEEEKGCLVLRWKSKSIVAASCWKCL